ncbi:unnamed protein product [Nesidiocoris tenuis]|nr:unnamed protein product [Nesidiocoris tenuis]
MADTEDSVSNDLWNTSVCRKSWADMVEEAEEKEEKRQTRMSSRADKKLPTVDEHGPYAGEEANLGGSDCPASIPKVESLPNFGKSVANGMKTPVKPRTPVKQPDLPQEDISLTGHLDVKLGLASPAKSCGRRVFSVKSTAPRSSPSKVSKRKAELPGDDEVLMPSPSKVLRSTPKKENGSPAPRDIVTRKRVRDMLTPTPKRNQRREKRDQETDPETLARRQRQIDYGKNTLGYERYRQMVPK